VLALICVLENQTDDKNQHIKGNYHQWQIHLEGVKRMIELRGGIGALDINRELRLTLMWYEKSHTELSRAMNSWRTDQSTANQQLT
jgi:hypothetical protein